jgi:ABC-type transport system substrate-binding protein
MSDKRISSLLAQVSAGKLSRRGVLEAGLKLGVATPTLMALIDAVPAGANAAPAAGHRMVLAQEGSPGTLVVLIQSGDEDIDPHYSYSTLSSTVALAVYEPLIRLKGETTDEFDGMMAESWEASDDQSTFTFKLHPDMTFQDGTPANAQAVKDCGVVAQSSGARKRANWASPVFTMAARTADSGRATNSTSLMVTAP